MSGAFIYLLIQNKTKYHGTLKKNTCDVPVFCKQNTMFIVNIPYECLPGFKNLL